MTLNNGAISQHSGVMPPFLRGTELVLKLVPTNMRPLVNTSLGPFHRSVPTEVAGLNVFACSFAYF